jgi:hypothetical protein
MRIRISAKPIPHHGIEYTVSNADEVVFTTDDRIEASYVATRIRRETS